MIKIAICEPSAALAGNLEAIILEAAGLLMEKLETEVYLSGEDFEAALQDGEVFGIVYMNLGMGDTGGVSLGKKLREKYSARDTLLIYLSEREDVPGQIFEAQPFLFLRLPLEHKDFVKKLYLAVENLQGLDSLFTFKKGSVFYQMKKRDILCLESAGRDIILYPAGREEIRYREAIKNEHEKLKAINFVRPHQSFIVNLDHVEQYHTDSMVLSNQLQVPISELRMRDTKKAILRFWEYRNK